MLKIAACAQELTLAHGLDGFTMDDLAVEVGVSRRTLFNYFGGKVEAVLGATPEAPADLIATFRAGGPSGDLVADVAGLAEALVFAGDFSRAEIARARQVINSDPRLLGASYENFRAVIGHYVEEIRIREGDAFDPTRAEIVIRLLGALFDLALDNFLAHPDSRPLAEEYADLVQRTRALFADPSH